MSNDNLVGVRLPEETLEKLDEYAEQEALNRSDALRQIIPAGLDQKLNERQFTRDTIDGIRSGAAIFGIVTLAVFLIIGGDGGRAAATTASGFITALLAQSALHTDVPEQIDHRIRGRLNPDT
jgi:predicted DNA-binding protein